MKNLEEISKKFTEELKKWDKPRYEAWLKSKEIENDSIHHNNI